MRIHALFIISFLIFSQAANLTAAQFDEQLEDALYESSPGEILDVYIVIANHFDLRGLAQEIESDKANLAQRHYRVLTEVRRHCENAQQPLLEYFHSAASSGQEIASYRSFWIANAVALSATARFIDSLRVREDIEEIYLDPPVKLIEPVYAGPALSMGAAAGIAPGIANSRAPELWAMGIDGSGALACDQDTGAQGDHPAFADRWRGLDPGVDPSAAWFDPVGGEAFPTDSGSHGTHTLGTMLGDDGSGNRIGMAPGAKWIGAKTIDVPGGNLYSDVVAAFQWAADPDGNPATMDDAPDVINNSWGIHGGNCGSNFWDAIDIAEAAGAVVIFAAGNEGPAQKTLRSPGDRIETDYNTFAIGALKQGGQEITSFSSRGPSKCDDATIKPEISAVGDNVISSIPENQYGGMSGTSMASPHVSGAVLLLRGAFPEATPDEIKMAMYETAVDLGDPGEDNVFGMGRLDVVEAYWFLLTRVSGSDGVIKLNRSIYSCDDGIEILLVDSDIETSAQVRVFSDTEMTPEIVTVTQSERPGIFKGLIATSGDAPAADGMLQVSNGDSISAVYVDANDGHGGIDVEKDAHASADCAAPEFAGLTGLTPLDNEVELTWDAAIDDTSVVYNVYRSDTSGIQDFEIPYAQTDQSPYTDLYAPNGVEWFYVVRAADEFGNEDDNTVELSGTPEGPDRLFWEDFESGDLTQWTIVDGGTNNVTWTLENPMDRASEHWSGEFVVADHESTGEFQQLNEQLITPPVDCSRHEGITIGFSHEFRQGMLERGRVDWSYDGAQWNLIKLFMGDAEGRVEFDVPDADLHQQVYFRFYYVRASLSAMYWGLDNVEVSGVPSTAPSITTTTTTTTTLLTTTTTIPADDDINDDAADDDTADDDTADDDVNDDAVNDDTVNDDEGGSIYSDDDFASGAGDDDDEGNCCG